MNINNLLAQENMTKYQLSKRSGVPYTTINDICNNRVKIEKCSAETLYRISKVLNVSIEDLVENAMEYRNSFETFKSNVCHMVKDMGDLDFIINTLENDSVRKYFDKNWYPESLYLLAMLDYLCRENGLPLCTNYNDIRSTKLERPIFPSSIVAVSAFSNSNKPKIDSLNDSIYEFKRFNIVENEVRNVN